MHSPFSTIVDGVAGFMGTRFAKMAAVVASNSKCLVNSGSYKIPCERCNRNDNNNSFGSIFFRSH